MLLNMPSPNARFRPRMDPPILSRLIQEAWKKHHAASLPPEDAARMGEGLARHLEGLYPLDDMRVLARYGLARTVTAINVRLHDGQAWTETAGVELGRQVHVAEGFQCLWAGGPRYGGDTHEGRGITSTYWESMSQQERQRFMDEQDERMRWRVPAVLEPFFSRILELRKAYRDECKRSAEWPAEERARCGAYPTWSQIAERWPVLGSHLREAWRILAAA